VQRPEPSWPQVIATTVRLWIDRHPVAGIKMTGWRLLALVAGAVIVISAGVTGIVIGGQAAPAAQATLHDQATSSGSRSAASLEAATATRASAARWVSAQVGPSAIVSCDPAMCAALQASGVAASRLVVLGTAAPDPLGSDLVIATPAVRSQFGARLAGVYAPEVIASFGSGTGRIDIRRDGGLRVPARRGPQRTDRRGPAANRQPPHHHAGRGQGGAPGRAGRLPAAGHAGRAGRAAADPHPRL
jgi:hypothetical protein